MIPQLTLSEWFEVRHLLVPSLEHCHGTHTEEDLFFMCAAGSLKLWQFDKSAALTEFQQYPRLKTLNLFLVGGDLEDLLSHEPEMVAYGKQNGCTRITGAGRLGWAKVSPGWSFNCTCLYKDFS